MDAYAFNSGEKVPDIALPAWPDGALKLSDLRGQWLVLYFYPRDNTPGCTTEACGFRDAVADFNHEHATIVGVSRDSLASHQRFAGKQSLSFRLIADTDEALCAAFDVVRMKNMYGKQVRGIERSTFLIDPKGVVRKVWRKVKVKGHVEDVLRTLRDLRH